MIECEECGDWLCNGCSGLTKDKMDDIVTITKTKGVIWICKKWEVEGKERRKAGKEEKKGVW